MVKSNARHSTSESNDIKLPEEAQRRAAFTYNAAADFYDASPLSFWNYFGRQTVELLSLPPGSSVLDVCCGAGASALPAARLVGPRGKVIGVDLAKELLELARAKAAQQHLGNIEFELGDMLSLRFPSGSFDAVVCVFGIFFVPDMAKAVRELWRLVRRWRPARRDDVGTKSIRAGQHRILGLD